MKKVLSLCLGVVVITGLYAGNDVYLIKNARILTVTQGILERGMLLIKNGKIDRVGQQLDIPMADVQVIDAEGMWVTPGLIDSHELSFGQRVGPVYYFSFTYGSLQPSPRD